MLARRLLPVVIAAAATFLSQAVLAGAPSRFPALFAEGVRLYKEMDFEGALEKFQLARKQPHGAAEEVQAVLYAGILQFELGKEAEADQLFSLGASLDPRASLPVKVSPRIEIAYEKQRSKFAALMHSAVSTPPVVAQPLPPAQPLPVAQPVPAAQPLAPARRSEPVPAKARRDVETRSGPSGRVVAGAVVLGVGVATAAVGGVAYGMAWSNYPRYEQNLATRAEAEEMDLDFKLGLGLLIGGAAMAVGGLVLVALPDGTSATASMAPVPGGAALTLTGTLP